MADEFRDTTVSGSEMHLLMQVLDRISGEQRAGFERLDRKMETMVPRTEFDDLKTRVNEGFAHVYREQEQGRTDHTAIRREMDAQVEKRDIEMKAVHSDIAAAAAASTEVENRRLHESRKMMRGIWATIGVAAVSGITTLIVGLVRGTLLGG